jgi:hypothetical protein
MHLKGLKTKSSLFEDAMLVTKSMNSDDVGGQEVVIPAPTSIVQSPPENLPEHRQTSPNIPEHAEGGDEAWAAVIIRSGLLGCEIGLCKKAHFEAVQAGNPDLTLYVFPEEVEALLALKDPAAMQRAHTVKVLTHGFILPPGHPEVEAWERLASKQETEMAGVPETPFIPSGLGFQGRLSRPVPGPRPEKKGTKGDHTTPIQNQS